MPVLASTAIALLVTGLLAADHPTPRPRGAAHAAPHRSASVEVPAPTVPARAAVVAVRDTTPVRVRIPGIGVDSALEPLEIGSNARLDAPRNPDRAGWWTGGADPGRPGAAVLVGHVDSRTGPAVFYRLSELRPGDRVDVLRADGTRAAFTVKALRSYAKESFPTDAVYGATADPVLRLLTCDGRYDRRRHSYPDNLVVFAEPAGTDPKAASTPSPSTTSRSRP